VHVLRELGQWWAPVIGPTLAKDGALTQDQEADWAQDQEADREEERTTTLVKVLAATRKRR